MPTRDEHENEALLKAYRNTSYCIAIPGGTAVVRIGQPNEKVDALLDEYGLIHWTIVTAHNPQSKRMSDHENERRQEVLISRLGATGWRTFDGENVSDDHSWPVEKSVLVLGPDRAEAALLGREFGQLAVVCGCLRQPAALIECAGNRDVSKVPET
jgi:hypothetical protein